MKTTNRLMTIGSAATAVLMASILAMSNTMLASGQTETISIGNGTTSLETTTVANATDFATAREQYLQAWNQTEFHALFETFVESYSVQGYGAYTEHPSDVFRPGDVIALYVEPVGFYHKPVLDAEGNTLYQMNLTSRVTVEDELGNVVGIIDDFPPLVLISHTKNTEIYLTVTVTQEQPFPEGPYKLTYTIGDGNTGESFIISKGIRIAQTVS